MYAIIDAKGMQVKVAPNDVVLVPFIEKPENELVEFNVYFLKKDDDVVVGRPYVEGARVVARILETVRDRKKVVFKFKKRKRYHVKKGHRQMYTKVLIEKIAVEE
ncbi:MAG: 50S ribosomal protein L21 [Candidatus Hydrothermae bacterium]|nr:50S ribosomal protein L21 [Candidatus Hydrothermae bacterium]